MNTVEIGMRIKKQRLLLGYTREELAELVNITPRFCYDLELGNKKMSIDTLCNMRNALRVSTDYLLFGESDNHDLDSILALAKTCPPEKRYGLEQIVSIFLQSIK